jgi:PAS domain S-box-containing protein
VERLLGLDPGTFEGTFDAFVEYRHSDGMEETVETIESARATGSRFRTEDRIQRDDDMQRWVESCGETYESDYGRKLMVGIITDITGRK